MRFQAHFYRQFGWTAFAFLACGGKELDESKSAPCSTDTDCAADEICKPPAAAMESRPQVVAPCLLQRCGSDADCTTGNVCAPNTPATPDTFGCGPMVCVPRCPETACTNFNTCQDGHCVPQLCNEEGAQACPEHFRCDPDAAATNTTGFALGSTITDPADALAAIAHGCVRKRCDEADGYTCKTLWDCAPDVATDPSGCLAQSCAETGECSSSTYICEPTSSNRRPPGEDAHGCVPRNCEEDSPCAIDLVPYQGAEPIPIGYCDFDGWRSDERGCARRNCDDGVAECNESRTCDPDATNADELGCRVLDCTEGALCTEGFVCDPGGIATDGYGCRREASSGGVGGSSGSAGQAGAAGLSGVGGSVGGRAGDAGSAGTAAGAGRGGANSAGSSNAGTENESETGGSAGTSPEAPSGYCAPRD